MISEELQIYLSASTKCIENCDILINHKDTSPDIILELKELKKIAEEELAETEEQILLEI